MQKSCVSPLAGVWSALEQGVPKSEIVRLLTAISGKEIDTDELIQLIARACLDSAQVRQVFGKGSKLLHGMKCSHLGRKGFPVPEVRAEIAGTLGVLSKRAEKAMCLWLAAKRPLEQNTILEVWTWAIQTKVEVIKEHCIQRVNPMVVARSWHGRVGLSLLSRKLHLLFALYPRPADKKLRKMTPEVQTLFDLCHLSGRPFPSALKGIKCDNGEVRITDPQHGVDLLRLLNDYQPLGGLRVQLLTGASVPLLLEAMPDVIQLTLNQQSRVGFREKRKQSDWRLSKVEKLTLDGIVASSRGLKVFPAVTTLCLKGNANIKENIRWPKSLKCIQIAAPLQLTLAGNWQQVIAERPARIEGAYKVSDHLQLIAETLPCDPPTQLTWTGIGYNPTCLPEVTNDWSRVRSLCLNTWKLNEELERQLSPRWEALTSIRLVKCRLGREDFERLVRQLPATVETLAFEENTSLSGHLWGIVQAMETRSKLQCLFADQANLLSGDDWDIQSRFFTQLANQPTINLSNTGITVKGLGLLFEALAGSPVEDLKLAANPATEEGVAIIAEGITCMPHLTRLELTGPTFSVKALRLLATAVARLPIKIMITPPAKYAETVASVPNYFGAFG